MKTTRLIPNPKVLAWLASTPSLALVLQEKPRTGKSLLANTERSNDEGILAAVGLMCLLKYASILDFIRTPLTKLSYFEKLFACSLCLGFWAGVAVALYFHFVQGETYWLMPLIACAACWLFDGVLGAIQAVEYLVPHEKPEHEDAD